MPISTVFTDESVIYDGVGFMQGTCHTHKRINHSKDVYVVGDTHTDSVEGLWSLIKNNNSRIASCGQREVPPDVPG